MAAQYIAFRYVDGNRLLPVVAILDQDDHARFPWGKWFSEVAPEGEYKKAPVEYVLVSESVATAIIDLIKNDRPLPSDFVAALPIVQ